MMKPFVVGALVVVAMSSARADLTDCQKFVANDPDMSSYIALNPDCTINKAAFEKVKANNPNMAFDSSKSSGPTGVDKITIPDGFGGTKQITIQRKDGQLAQIQVAKVQAPNGYYNNMKDNETDSYAFDCSSGSCIPKLGVESQSIVIKPSLPVPGDAANLYGSDKNPMTIDSQIFDTGLCKNLKSFFKQNPKASACFGDFEKKSKDLLANYERDRTNSPYGMGGALGNGPYGYGTNPYGTGMGMGGMYYGQGAYATPFDQKAADDFMAKHPNVRSQPVNTSKLALAMSLYSDCLRDKRIASTIDHATDATSPAKKKATGPGDQ